MVLQHCRVDSNMPTSHAKDPSDVQVPPQLMVGPQVQERPHSCPMLLVPGLHLEQQDMELPAGPTETEEAGAWLWGYGVPSRTLFVGSSEEVTAC